MNTSRIVGPGPAERCALAVEAMAKHSEHRAHRIDRKALKEDAFQDTMFWLVDWAYQRRVLLIAIGTAVVLLVAAGFGGYYYWQAQRRAASAQFYQAEHALANQKLDQKDRLAYARKAYEAFVAEHPSSSLAPVAWMHIAALAWQQEDQNAARKAYGEVLSHGDSTQTQRDLAHIGLAKLDEAQGKLDAATKEYEAVSDGTFDELKSLSLGRVAAAEHKDDQARQYFEKAARATSGSALAEWARQNLDYQP